MSPNSLQYVKEKKIYRINILNSAAPQQQKSPGSKFFNIQYKLFSYLRNRNIRNYSTIIKTHWTSIIQVILGIQIYWCWKEYDHCLLKHNILKTPREWRYASVQLDWGGNGHFALFNDSEINLQGLLHPKLGCSLKFKRGEKKYMSAWLEGNGNSALRWYTYQWTLDRSTRAGVCVCVGGYLFNRQYKNQPVWRHMLAVPGKKEKRQCCGWRREISFRFTR